MKYDYLEIAKQITLKNTPLDNYAVFLFGSRAAGNAHLMSDIDIGFLGKKALPVMVKALLEDALDESIVPFRVDMIDFYNVDGTFKNEALKKITIWNLPQNLNLNLTC